jgi:GntR family transcriptional regulator
MVKATKARVAELKPAQEAVDSPVPLYHQIYMVLRERIMEGLYPPREPMPSEMEFSVEFGVSRVTIRKTFEFLEEEGLIVRMRGRGTFTHPQLASRPVEARVRGLVDNLLAMGLRTKVQVLEFRYVAASPDVALSLELDAAARVQRAVRLRSYKGRPFSYATTFVPEAVGQTFTKSELASTPLIKLFERAGIRLSSANQRVSASAADPRVAELLETSVGAPLLNITRIVRDQDGRPVEYIKALYRPDRYEFETSMTWDVDGEGGSGLWRFGDSEGKTKT